MQADRHVDDLARQLPSGQSRGTTSPRLATPQFVAQPGDGLGEPLGSERGR
jgi:hypothetical protein